jgi:peptidyl-prolyl cis-trans isomerase A (cyclophilin A)
MLLVPLLLSLAQTPQGVVQAPPDTRPHPTGPTVVLEVAQGHTPFGTITVVLDEEKAPITVRNFLEYVRSGHYDGTIFHRVMPGFMIQGGGYTPDLVEKPTRPPIHNEARNGLRNTRGTIAMARTNDPDSATSQFFINVRDNYRLDFGIDGAGYAVFGEVVDGMDVVDRIVSVPTTTRGPHENIPQFSVVIERAYEVKAAAPAAPPPAPEEPKKGAPPGARAP